MANRRSRLPRIEHGDDFHIEDETAHLWAVSYADFLMVLLSFFILFFSTDDQAKDDIIERISKQTSKMGIAGSKDSSSLAGTAGTGIDGVDVDSLMDVLKAKNITVEKLRRKIIFKFDDNIYGLGKYKLNTDSRSELFAVLDLLKPYYESVDITIVGHTDSLKMRKKENDQFIKNNFDLSIFRATRALEAAIGYGAPIEALAAKGSADFRRNSRTLSLVVTPRNLE